MKRSTIVLIVVGAVMLVLFVALVGGGMYFVATYVHATKTSQGTAEQEFTAVRQRFAGREPFLVIEDRGRRLRRQIPDRKEPAPPLTSLHVLIWDPEKDQLVKVDVPF